MKNRSLFIVLVSICIIAPGFHYFIGGSNFDNSTTRDALVIVQIVVGIALLFIYGRKPKESDLQ